MTFLLPTPRLMKLRPTPHWSLPAASPRCEDAAAATPSASTETGLAAVPAPWGTCEIVLVAERQSGVTHPFFHDWRFEAVLRAGEPAPGVVLARSPIAPDRRRTVTAAFAPVSVALQFRADAPHPLAPGREAFVWALPTPGDELDPHQPLVLALTRLRQQLRDAGWRPAGVSATRYHKPAPGDLAATASARGPAPPSSGAC